MLWASGLRWWITSAGAEGILWASCGADIGYMGCQRAIIAVRTTPDQGNKLTKPNESSSLQH